MEEVLNLRGQNESSDDRESRLGLRRLSRQNENCVKSTILDYRHTISIQIFSAFYMARNIRLKSISEVDHKI